MSCSEQHTFNTYVSAEGPLPPSEVALRSLELGSIPAATMLLGSLATILAPKPPPKVVAHALQHLAAGIMMCAIAMELVPPMAKAKGQSSVFALVVGFSLGVAVMIGLSIFLDEVGDGGSDGGESEGDLDVGLGDVAAAESEALLSGELRDSAVDGESEDSGGVAPRSKVGQAYSHVSDEQGAGGIRGGARVELQQPMFPWLFAFCVYVDSCMDGLLVGLALVTGNSAGVFMAAAMAVEMGFLGSTHVCTRTYAHSRKKSARALSRVECSRPDFCGGVHVSTALPRTARGGCRPLFPRLRLGAGYVVLLAMDALALSLLAPPCD